MNKILNKIKKIAYLIKPNQRVFIRSKVFLLKSSNDKFVMLKNLYQPIIKMVREIQASRKQMKLTSETHLGNIGKKGNVPASLKVYFRQKKKEEGTTVGPILLALFLFVVVGSGIL